MGERMQRVEPDILMLEDPSERKVKSVKPLERECNVIEYRSETRNGDVNLVFYFRKSGGGISSGDKS